MSKRCGTSEMLVAWPRTLLAFPAQQSALCASLSHTHIFSLYLSLTHTYLLSISLSLTHTVPVDREPRSFRVCGGARALTHMRMRVPSGPCIRFYSSSAVNMNALFISVKGLRSQAFFFGVHRWLRCSSGDAALSSAGVMAPLTIIPILLFFLFFGNASCGRIIVPSIAEGSRSSPLHNGPRVSEHSSALFPNGTNITRYDFPTGFLFGSLTSAMKHEGAELVDGKSLNVWDYFARNVKGASADGSIPGQCGNNYYRYAEDHQLVVGLGMNAYRLSIAWSRIFPNGSGEVNEQAISHYNDVINDVLDKGLELFVTLWTQDHPHKLESDYMGPLNKSFIDDFANYAEICFAAFGDRVKKWITFDEPNDWAGLGYATSQNPPGRCTSNIDIYGSCDEGDSGTEPYIVGHILILAHAEAAEIYRNKYQEAQNGSIGITLWHRWFEPLTDSEEDLAASQRATDFLLGWFLDPILFGDYPDTMKQYAGTRLPSFTVQEKAKVNGSIDFLGLNLVTAFYAYNYNYYIRDYPDIRSYYLDAQAKTTGEKDGVMIGEGTHDYAVPWIMRKTLEYIKYRYNNFQTYITQTGWGILFTSEDDESNITDDERVHFFQSYYNELRNAILDGANVKGVFAWSLVDGFEFNLGLQTRLGIHYVDDNFDRYPRKSAEWFRLMLADNATDTTLM